MGNTQSDQRSDQEFERYIHSMTLVRKEHSENLGRDIDLFRPESLEFEEALVLLIELSFDEAEHPGQDPNAVVGKFKDEVNLRKNITSRFLSQLLFMSYKRISGLCTEVLVCRLALEYSEENLFKMLNDRLMYRSSTTIPDLPSPVAFQHFLGSLVEGLSALHQRNMTHGFLLPVNVLVFNKSSKQPLFKLLDVALISKHKKLPNQLLQEDALRERLLRSVDP